VPNPNVYAVTGPLIANTDDGFLVIDLNADGTRGAGDGQIDQARELAFALWGADGVTDLQALAEAVDANGDKFFDSNNDGVLDDQDTIWSELRVWQDINQNGSLGAALKSTPNDLMLAA
jgi:hypothetical protein